MIELLLRHREISRPDLIRWAMRSVVVGPLTGAMPGILWGVLMFGPLNIDYNLSILIGALIGLAFGVLATQALGWSVIQASTQWYICATMLAVTISFIFITVMSKFYPTVKWVLPVFVFIWLGTLAWIGRKK